MKNNDVYTDYDGPEHNMKPRLVRCIPCKFEVVTNLPQPKCGRCKRPMITVIERHGLADRDNLSTSGT